MRPRPAIERFESKVSPCPITGCWWWIGAVNSEKYPRGIMGNGTHRGTPMLAARFIYQHSVGAIPAGYDVCHKCDQTLCVNPAHLFVGTRKDNMQDAKRKGRMRGMFVARLDAVDIKRRVDAGESKTALAKEYGVSWWGIHSAYKRAVRA